MKSDCPERRRRLPRDRPLVRRQGSRPDRPRRDPRRHARRARHAAARSSASSSSPWSTPGPSRTSARPTRSRWPTTTSRRTASSTRWSAPGPTPTSGPSWSTTPCTTGRRPRSTCGRSTRPPAAATAHGDLTFHRLPGHDLDLDTHSTLFSGEQSNSSVAFGEDSLMKVFRKVNTGRNPDIVIHGALTERDSDHVAALYGWLELARPRRRPRRASRSSSRCSSSSCAPPATAGTWRWPACATCSPRPTCTPTRSAATSRARPTGSVWPPRRSTTCWPSSSPPRRGAPTT